jgi:type III secretion protein J
MSSRRCNALRLMILFVLTGLLQACDMDLYTNLSEREANAMVAVLLRDGIPASRKVQDNGQLTVVVDKQRFPEAMARLDDAGLPQQKFSNMGEGFTGHGLVSSPVQERAQMVYALSEELSHTVSEIDGIVSARVHVVLPDNDLLKRVISPSSASVLVRYDPAVDINQLIPQIKTLVANGISGLGYDGVSVTAIKAAVAASRPNAQPRLASFMGLWMLEADLPRARFMFGCLLVAVLALGGVLGTQFWKRRKAEALYVLKGAE